ncbi:hypothetical protein ECANGB1_2732 [Enterospora canceri]|uniref:Secreted protein n=1 Tax=Enterospora canceri TaxID=1081671 RepID=A0A1Y1S4E8_9MICR|nr:hypothetical protein ECANGB1_2732 [Enterospora canceri]
MALPVSSVLHFLACYSLHTCSRDSLQSNSCYQNSHQASCQGHCISDYQRHLSHSDQDMASLNCAQMSPCYQDTSSDCWPHCLQCALLYHFAC